MALALPTLFCGAAGAVGKSDMLRPAHAARPLRGRELATECRPQLIQRLWTAGHQDWPLGRSGCPAYRPCRAGIAI